MAAVSASPNFICLKIPSRGKDGNARKFDMVNQTPQRITFKIKGRHADKFQSITPSLGFVEPRSSTEVWFQPKVIDIPPVVFKNDTFKVLWAPAPPGSETMEAKDVWAKGSATEPKAPSIVDVELWVCDPQNNDLRPK